MGTDCDTLLDQINSATDTMTQYADQISGAQDQVEQDAEDLSFLSNELSSDQGQLATLQLQENSIIQYLGEISDSEQTLNGDISSLTEELDNLRAFLDSPEGRDSPYYAEALALYNQTQSAVDQDESQLTGLQSMSQFFSGELTDVQNDETTLEQGISNVQAQYNQVAAQSQTDQQNLTNLQNAIVSISDSLNDMLSEYNNDCLTQTQTQTNTQTQPAPPPQTQQTVVTQGNQGTGDGQGTGQGTCGDGRDDGGTGGDDGDDEGGVGDEGDDGGGGGAGSEDIIISAKAFTKGIPKNATQELRKRVLGEFDERQKELTLAIQQYAQRIKEASIDQGLYSRMMAAATDEENKLQTRLDAISKETCEWPQSLSRFHSSWSQELGEALRNRQWEVARSLLRDRTQRVSKPRRLFMNQITSAYKAMVAYRQKNTLTYKIALASKRRAKAQREIVATATHIRHMRMQMNRCNLTFKRVMSYKVASDFRL